MATKKKALLLFVLATICASSAAFASIPRSTFLEPPASDLHDRQLADDRAAIDNAHLLHRSLDRALFAPGVEASLPKTRVWGSRVPDPLFERETSELTRAVRKGYAEFSSKNAEGIRDYAIPDLYLAASSESKTKLLTGFKAAPFIEPATGHAYFRARWYDPSTGSWLTPDPSGYSDSSNLYAFARNDPVNLSDPTGEIAPALVYLGWVAVNTLVDTAVEGTFNEIGDWWTGTETEFDWNKSLTTNFAVNLATGGIGGKAAKLRYLAKLRNPVTRKIAAEGIEYAADVAITGTINTWLNDQDPREAYASAAVGGALGRGVAYGLRHGKGILGRLAGYRGGRGEFLEEVNEALARRRGESVFTTQRGNRTGFDLGAYADEAFLDEVKFYNGMVHHNEITSAGLHFAPGVSSTRALRRNLNTARTGARAADLFDAAESLRQESFTLRLIGGPRTTFDPFIGDALTQRGISHSFHRISRSQIGSYIWFGY